MDGIAPKESKAGNRSHGHTICATTHSPILNQVMQPRDKFRVFHFGTLTLQFYHLLSKVRVRTQGGAPMSFLEKAMKQVVHQLVIWWEIW